MRPRKRSATVRSLISASNRYDERLLSAISLWECSKWLEKQRLAISCDPEEWFRVAWDMPQFRLVPISPSIAYRATILPKPFHDDPADPIIVATAREENATLVTADERLIADPHCRSYW